MNILLVGNGFDLAHDLPTDYKSFVKFLNAVQSAGDSSDGNPEYIRTIEDYEFCAELKQFLLDPYKVPKDSKLEELRNLMCNNFWIAYFNPIGNAHNNWISFERKISEIVQLLALSKKTTDKNERRMLLSQLVPIFRRAGIDETMLYGKSSEGLTKQLLNDLDRLIRCLEIYLCLCLEIVHIEKRLQAVSEIGSVDKILSFNYTNTFERVYQSTLEKVPEYCYIHGRAKIGNTIDSNNMVLGIDEYLDEAERNKDVEFVRFKKFYQRIFKQTDYNYTNWVNKDDGTNLFIIGHSLDITDRDVLRDILLQPGVQTTIFYHNKGANADQITNLLKVLGYDNLNALARGRSNSSITFRELL